jgi:hypothetical protein
MKLPNSLVVSRPMESTSQLLDRYEVADLLRRQIEVQQRLLQISKSVGIATYRPHYKQHLFHSANTKRRGFFAGNRTGKSQSSAAETCAWALGERPWYRVPFDITDRKGNVLYKHEGGQNHPLVKQGLPPWPTKQLILTTDWDKVDEIWTGQRGDRQGKIWQMLPQGWVKSQRRNHSGAVDTIEGHNGALIKFDTVQSFIKDPQGSESSDWDRVAADEPIPEDMWKASARGLIDRNGQGDFTLTALKERWIYDYFFEIAGQSESPREGRLAIKATTYDNPYMSDEAIRLFEQDLTEDEKQCRIHGIPLELSGLVYKEFDYARHVLTQVPLGWRDYHLPARHCILDLRIDNHPQTPHAVLFLATGPDQVPIVCHEIWQACDAEDLAAAVSGYVSSTGCFVNTAKCDPSAWIPDAITRQASVAQTFHDKGLIVGKASKDKSNGILNLRSVLKSPNGIRFSPNLRRTLWEISRYSYDKENKPIDKDDHMMENLYRLFIDKPTWFDPDKALGFAVPDMDFTERNLSAID